MKTYKETLDYLYAKLPMFQRVGDKAFKKDLSNTLALLKALNNPHKQLKTIHVAGTNGKGSVCHIMAAVIQEAGYKTGVYTSPHYKDFRERIKINATFVNEDYIIDFVENNKSIIEEINPSFFEITVAMAFDYFAKENVDIAIIETGMGGRFDSTNVITPLLSIITNISFDHQQFLGNTLDQIAFEKAGIIKQNVPVLIGEYQRETHEVFVNKAMETESPLFYAEELFEISDYTYSLLGATFKHVEGRKAHYFASDLSGSYQKYNLQTALAALLLIKEYFPYSDKQCQTALLNIRKSTYFIGRSMVLNENPLCIADSAHNEAGINQLLQIIQQTPHQQLHFVYGTVSDKDLSKVFPLLPKEAIYYLCKADIPRGMQVDELLKSANKFDLISSGYNSVKEAYNAALKNAKEDDLILVSGSIFVVAEVL